MLTLVLAGHETTANSLAWTLERLVRTPAAYAACATTSAPTTRRRRLVEATVSEGMRARPVIPIVARRVTVPWRLGEFACRGRDAGAMNIVLVHHRADVYPDPFAFRPERCLRPQARDLHVDPVRRRHPALPRRRAGHGRTARRARGDRPAGWISPPRDPEPERALHRNVTMIPERGARVVVRAKLAG